MLATCGVFRGLAKKFLACRESAEELVVEVVAICEDDESGVGHGTVLDDFPGIENHGEAFAAALGVPDNADAAIAFGGSSVQRAFDGFVDRVELVIAGNFLEQSGFRVFKDNEVPDEVDFAE